MSSLLFPQAAENQCLISSKALIWILPAKGRNVAESHYVAEGHYVHAAQGRNVAEGHYEATPTPARRRKLQHQQLKPTK